ncbi:hypothetical protein SAMN05421772_11442 [Paracoccus saliphilus]|uniref:Uncharacterized protein n=1 Tax=Paracoccus saliphilus TaxID=405559 RepID=A0AA45W6V4_9RHOB|nr:hypothetical protein SAMN05421772_11442 [Paracoccus saliphilus]
MSVRLVIVFLLVMVILALVSGPGFRKFLLKLLGINRRDR